MQVAVRSYLTAGVAIIGAGAIATAPVSPITTADLEVPAVKISTPVELTAAVNPIAAYLALAENTVGNIAGLGQAVLANPAPILRQIIINQLATAGTVLTALQTAGAQLVENLNTIGLPALQQAAADIAAGNFTAAAANLVTAIVQPPLFAALPLLPALQTVFEKPVANLLAVTQQFQTIVALTGFGVLSPISSTIYATGQAIQNVYDAATAGDPLGALGALMAAPAVIVDGFLNGYGADSGLLSPGLGPIGALLQIRDLIANAITPQAPTPAVADVSEVAAVPAAAAATVTLSTEATESTAVEAVASTQDRDETGVGTDASTEETSETGATTEQASAEETEEEATATDESSTDETATDTDPAVDDDAKDDDAGSDDAGAGDADADSGNSGSGSTGSDSSDSSDGSTTGSGADSGDTGGSSDGSDSGSES